MAQTTVDAFARRQASERLARVMAEVRRVAESPGADEIHDLRVSIRRFRHVLRAFLPLFDAKNVQKVRRRLKRVMEITSETRNRDIALEFLDRQPEPAPPPRLRHRLQLERQGWCERLLADLNKLIRKDAGARWRKRLDLDEVAV